MFWGEVREAKPKKGFTSTPSMELPAEKPGSTPGVQEDEIHGVVTGRISCHDVVAPGPGPSKDTPSEAEDLQNEEHDGSIDPNSMSLCGLSTDPLPPLQGT